jgi:hypothetical protein
MEDIYMKSLASRMLVAVVLLVVLGPMAPAQNAVLVATHGLRALDSAGLFAMTWSGYSEAFIGYMNAKYHFNFWRPVTAIRESGGNPFVRGEVNAPFGCGELFKFVLKRCDNRGSGEQTAVFRKRSEPHQHSFVLERRNPIADRLASLRWHSRTNRLANLVQTAAGGFRDTSEVFFSRFLQSLT